MVEAAQQSTLFPVFLNLSGRLIAVVGGGRVGTRKATVLLAAGARLRLIDPVPLLHLQATLPSNKIVEHVQEAYQSNHLAGCSLVFAAATPEVNAAVVMDARARGIWVNSATDPNSGDFLVPSVVRSGQFTLAASTAGAAPALARRVREKLELEFDAAFAEWIAVLAEVREVVLAHVPNEARRSTLLDSFADWPWLARVRSEGAAAVRVAMIEIVQNNDFET